MPKGDNPNSRKNLKPFKKGETGNRSGPPRIPPEYLAFRRMTFKQIMDIGQDLISGDIPALEAIVKRYKDPNPEKRPTYMRVALAAVLLDIVNEKDSARLCQLLDKFYGKGSQSVFLQQNNVTIKAPEDLRTIKAEAKILLEDMTADDDEPIEVKKKDEPEPGQTPQ